MKQKVLVIAAHPDDEVLGCGATIARHALEGEEVHVVIMAEGLTSRAERRDRRKQSRELSALAKAAHGAHKVLGSSSLTLLEFPDNRMDSIDRVEIAKKVERLVAKFQPDTVYTHHPGDANIDHRVVHDAVVVACRPMPGRRIKSVLSFEVASSTEWQFPGSRPNFNPNVFVDVSRTLARKLQALRAYASEMRPWPHARSIEALEHLAKWRGATIGVEAAEAFVLGRSIL